MNGQILFAKHYSSDFIHQMRWVQHSVMKWRHTNQSMIGQFGSCFWQQIQSFNSLLLVITTFLIFQPAWLLINWLWWMVYQFTACFFIDCGCARKTWGKLLEEEFWWKLKAGPDLLINPWESNCAKKKTVLCWSSSYHRSESWTIRKRK